MNYINTHTHTHIHTHTHTGDIEVHVEIVDTPCGNDIPMEDQDPIRHPAISTLLSRAASRQGLGLGLGQGSPPSSPPRSPSRGPSRSPSRNLSNCPSPRASFLLSGVRRMSVLSTPINQEGGAFDSHVDHISSLVESMGLSPPQANISRQISRSVSSVQTLLVTIEDHGVGVPEQLRDTLFQPFRQAQRMAGGTGKFLSYRIQYHELYYPSYCPLYMTPHISSYTQPLIFPLTHRIFHFFSIHLHLYTYTCRIGFI